MFKFLRHITFSKVIYSYCGKFEAIGPASEESRPEFASRVFTPVVISGCLGMLWMYALRVLKLLMRNGSSTVIRADNRCAPENPAGKFRLYSEALIFFGSFLHQGKKELKARAACGMPIAGQNSNAWLQNLYLSDFFLTCISSFSQSQVWQPTKRNV